MIRREANRNSMQVFYVVRPKSGRKKLVNTAMRNNFSISQKMEDFSDEHTARQRYDRNLSSKIRK